MSTSGKRARLSVSAPRRDVPIIARQKLDFRTISLSVPAGTGRRRIQGSVQFRSRVLHAGVALNGFKFDYVNSDHHINVLEADTDVVSVAGNTVTIRAECNYADKSFDDSYFGYVTATVIAEVE